MLNGARPGQEKRLIRYVYECCVLKKYWGKAKYLSDPDLPEDKCQGTHYRAFLKILALYFGDLLGTGGSEVDRAEAEAAIVGCISSVATTQKVSMAQHLQQFFNKGDEFLPMVLKQSREVQLTQQYEGVWLS